MAEITVYAVVRKFVGSRDQSFVTFRRTEEKAREIADLLHASYVQVLRTEHLATITNRYRGEDPGARDILTPENEAAYVVEKRIRDLPRMYDVEPTEVTVETFRRMERIASGESE